MHHMWRLKRKTDPEFPKPTMADLSYHASLGIFEKLYRFEPDVVLFVSGVLVIGDVYTLIRKRHQRGGGADRVALSDGAGTADRRSSRPRVDA